jgi:cytochrome c553
MDFRDGARVDASGSMKMHFAASRIWRVKLDRSAVALARQLSQWRASYSSVRANPAVRAGAAVSSVDASKRYARQCSSCHGLAGVGNAAQGVPWIAGQHFPYLLRQLRQFRAAHRATPGTNMGPTTAAGSDQELAALADYLAGLPH